MNDLVTPQEIVRRAFHFWHRPITVREYRHPEIRGLLIHTRKCRVCGKPMKEKVIAE